MPFRLSREHDGSSGSQVPSHRRFNVGVIVVHGATAAIKDHGNKLIKLSLPIFRPERVAFPIRGTLTFHYGRPPFQNHPSLRTAPTRTCQAPARTCSSRSASFPSTGFQTTCVYAIIYVSQRRNHVHFYIAFRITRFFLQGCAEYLLHECGNYCENCYNFFTRFE